MIAVSAIIAKLAVILWSLHKQIVLLCGLV
jgi:hypothetical protein